MFHKVVNALVFFSVGLYFFEVACPACFQGHGFFIFAERLIALLFTYELFHQWKREVNYPFSLEFWVDLAAVLPFWIGFFVPAEHLGLIRSLRVLRLFKLFWTSDSFRVLTLTFRKAWPMLKSAGVCVICIVLFGASILFQLEPDNFGSIGNAIYFCFTAASTVGFGDFSPKTPWGKFTTICILYGPALMVCGAVVGVIGSAYQVAVEEFKKQNGD
jgi:voltage-gated potassium channel